ELKAQPKFYAGVSTCFRKEAGKTGVDNWGIFRVHQFEKIEQFCVCHPEDSWKIHDKMIAHSEEFTKSLGLPYHVINICSGELNNAAAKKYDLEAWFPGYVEIDKTKEAQHPGMRELVSCSNCLDYQSRAVEIRCGQPKKDNKGMKGKKVYVHMLNATLCATTRCICCILENHQTPEGVVIPEVLIPFMNKTFVKVDSKGRKHIPYTKPTPIHKELKSNKKKGKGGKSKSGGKKEKKESKKKAPEPTADPKAEILKKLEEFTKGGKLTEEEHAMLVKSLKEEKKTLCTQRRSSESGPVATLCTTCVPS
ncbi:hypothetical protein AAMO2058_001439000, partial [Amorphochlora amoebiformis]